MAVLSESVRRAVEAGDYYEAHQLYLSISQKLVKQAKHAEARRLVSEGVMVLREAGQVKSALDLMARLADTFVGEWSGEYTECCTQVLGCLPLESCLGFISRVVEQSQGRAPRLYETLGRLFLDGRDYFRSVEYWVLAGQTRLIRDMLEAIPGTVDQDEYFQIWVYSVLKCLQATRHQDAYDLVLQVREMSLCHIKRQVSFVSKHRNTESRHSLYESAYPLVNFAQLIVFIAQRSDGALFHRCKKQYLGQMNSANCRMMDELERVYGFQVEEQSRFNVGSVMSVIRALAGGSEEESAPEVD